jgi:mRNA interferase MazF
MKIITTQFDVWLTNLNPTQGSEISKIRPCVIISPDAVNKFVNTILICPFTSSKRKYPFRVNSNFNEQEGQLATEQIRSIDKTRLIKKLGILDQATSEKLCQTLVEMFEY